MPLRTSSGSIGNGVGHLRDRLVCPHVRYTPEGSVGRQTRVSIKVPFRKDEFERTFGRVLRQKFSAIGNDQCHATLEELNQGFGVKSGPVDSILTRPQRPLYRPL